MSKLQKFLPLLLALVTILGMITGMRLQSSLEADGYVSPSPSGDDESIYEALEHIRSKYYGELDEKEFSDEVVTTMIEQLDGYSRYFKARSDTLYRRYIRGNYEGIGIEFAEFEDRFYVSRIVLDSPADRAGLSVGDQILSIGETVIVDSLDRYDLLELTDLPPGDTLDISIISLDGAKKELAIQVSSVSIPLVHDFIINAASEVSYIKIDRFYDGVFRDFMDALDHQKMDSAMLSHLIIDLRNNPGGVVEETVKILNQLIREKEKLLVSTNDNQGRVKKYNTNGRGFLKLDRIAILVNGSSASASEILAGVLQDYDQAVVIGESTYGKGVIQQNYHLSNDGSINLTVGSYILPTGRIISRESNQDTTYQSLRNKRILQHAKGITPDVVVDDCVPALNYSEPLARLTIKHRLLDRESIETYLTSNLALELAEVYDMSLDDTCSVVARQHLRWGLLNERLTDGERIPMDFVDSYIKEAVDVITSDRYDEILGN